MSMTSGSPKQANTDVIGEVLDLQPIEVTPISVPAAPSPDSTSTVETDFEYARGNMIAAIEKGQEALSGILDVANMSQHPRGYEVVATLIKTLSDANKDLLELSKRKKDLVGTQEPTTINNNLYVGSTAELLKMLKDKGK